MMKVIESATRVLQGIMYVCGISIHNNFTNECVADFSCCCKDIHNPINKRLKWFFKDIRRNVKKTFR